MFKENLGNCMREVTFYVTISLTVIFLTTLRMAMVALFLFQYMYSHVKFSQQCFDSDGKKLPRSFTETLFVKLLKSYTAEQ